MRLFVASSLVFANTLLNAGFAYALLPTTKVIPQPDSPIQLTSYRAEYVPSSGTYVRQGIQHSVEYRNVGAQVIDVVQIGLVSFDVWNEFLDRTLGLSMETLAPNGSKKGVWVATAYADFSFLTGVAYVSKVRFRDGTIWKADLDTVTQALRQVEADFDPATLKQKGNPKQRQFISSKKDH